VIRLAYLTFYGQIGGAEMCLLTLLDGLDRARFAPLVVLSGPGPLDEELRRREIPRVFERRMGHITRGAGSPGGLASNVGDFVGVERALRHRFRADRIDLVHAFITPALKFGGIAARWAGIPAVGSMHDLLAPPFTWLKRRLIATNVNLFYRRLVVPSQATRATVVRAGVHDGKVAVVHNGVDASRFARDPAAGARARADLGLAPDTPLVGLVARFVPLKGHDVLLRAVKELAARRGDVRCLIVGDAVFEGEETWKLRMLDLARELGVQSRVIFTGWRTDIPELLSALDVFVQPSTEGDSFPTSILEAMAAGLPVVAGAGGPAPEMVEHGVTGCLVTSGSPTALAESILHLLERPALAAAMGAAGRAKVGREFTRDRYCRAMEQIYETALIDMGGLAAGPTPRCSEPPRHSRGAPRNTHGC
jgi:glycosyltransferase involved in cell wall biosynthesis